MFQWLSKSLDFKDRNDASSVKGFKRLRKGNKRSNEQKLLSQTIWRMNYINFVNKSFNIMRSKTLIALNLW